MKFARTSLLVVLTMLGCRREPEPETRAPVAAPVAAAARDAGPATAAGPTWYRAALRTADGVEVRFFLGVPAPGAPGAAVLKVGDLELRNEATFDGKTLKIPLEIHQTSIDATVGPDGSLAGSFSTTWRAWSTSSLPLTATKVAAPAPSALATVAPEGAALDLGAPRSVWRLAAGESGVSKLTVTQTAPGDFTAVVHLDTGNMFYLAGNGRGDAMVLCGFDGTSAYRLELALGADRASARGKLFGGHHLDWRETLTATRGEDFVLALKPKAEAPGRKIGLPRHPALEALPRGPLLVELAASWCSTCRYAAPLLVELDREYRPRGLHMVTLLYELTDDPAADARQAEAFKKAYGVTWPVIPIQGSLDDFAEIIPSGLADLNPSGFPITLFLTADRSLAAIHAGFPAPSAAAELRQVTSEFRARIESLLARPADIRRP